MYTKYLETKYGVMRIECCDDFLHRVTLSDETDEERSNELCEKVAQELDEYFEGKRKSFDVKLLDDNSFRSRVYNYVKNGEYGVLLSYKDVANALGTKAYQAVGSAMANNPFFIVMPCHRVIKSDGTTGDFYYGQKMKLDLQFHELETLFKENVVKEKKFSQSEINAILSNEKLCKMFEVMDISDSFLVFNSSYENMISNIIYQQVAFKVARKSELLLFSEYKYSLDPNVLINLSNADFKKFGITGRRCDYIRFFSKYYIENQNFFDNISNYSDDQIFEKLVKIKGIGVWTIEMFLLFGLGRDDVISYGDLIIRKGISKLYDTDDNDDIKGIIESLRLYGTIISINLWKYMEQGYYKLH